MGKTSYVTGAHYGTRGKLAKLGWNKKMTHVRRETVV